MDAKNLKNADEKCFLMNKTSWERIRIRTGDAVIFNLNFINFWNFASRKVFDTKAISKCGKYWNLLAYGWWYALCGFALNAVETSYCAASWGGEWIAEIYPDAKRHLANDQANVFWTCTRKTFSKTFMLFCRILFVSRKNFLFIVRCLIVYRIKWKRNFIKCFFRIREKNFSAKVKVS